MELVVRIENKNGVNVVSSRVVAEQLGKQHAHVLRDLEKLLENPNVDSLIISSTYKAEGQSRSYKEYLLTKDGFTLYMFNIQGYNDFKMAYINKFNEMESMVNSIGEKERLLLGLFSNDSMVVANSHKALVALETKPLLDKIEKDKPKVDVMDAVLESDKYFDCSELSKMLNVKSLGRNNLFKYLRENEVLRTNNEPYQRFVDNKCCKVCITVKNGMPIVKPLFSVRMLYWLQKRLGITSK